MCCFVVIVIVDFSALESLVSQRVVVLCWWVFVCFFGFMFFLCYIIFCCGFVGARAPRRAAVS